VIFVLISFLHLSISENTCIMSKSKTLEVNQLKNNWQNQSREKNIFNHLDET